MSSKSKTKTKTGKKTVKAKAERKKFNVVRLGGNVGSLFGPTGRKIGAEAGRLFRQVTGYGEYKVSANNLLTTNGEQLPMFKNMRHGSNIRHREYLGDVITSPKIGVFDITKYSLQPGLLSTFPWFAASAENYEEYTINGMIIEFKSNSYDALASTNTASGTVIMTTQYNVYEPDFVNKLTMEQYEFTCSGKPSVDIIHPVECARIETPTSVLRIRNSAVSGDLGLYDWGNFYIATVGMQGASTNIGELWISYDITLFKPKLRQQSDVGDHWVISGGDYTNVDPALNYFGRLGTGSIPLLTNQSDLGTSILASGTVDPFALDTIMFPRNYYGNVAIMVSWFRLDAKATTPEPGVTFNTSGSTIVPLYLCRNLANTLTGQPNPSMTPGISMGIWDVAFYSINGGGSIRLSGGPTVTPLTGFDLFVVSMPASLTQ